MLRVPEIQDLQHVFGLESRPSRLYNTDPSLRALSSPLLSEDYVA